MTTYSGRKRKGAGRTVPMKEAHFRRWQVAVAFAAITVAFVVGLVFVKKAINENHDTIRELKQAEQQQALILSDLQRAKASVGSLEKTNCGLRQFLQTARDTRLKEAQATKTMLKNARKADAPLKARQALARSIHADTIAAGAYQDILNVFPPDGCKRFRNQTRN